MGVARIILLFFVLIWTQSPQLHLYADDLQSAVGRKQGSSALRDLSIDIKKIDPVLFQEHLRDVESILKMFTLYSRSGKISPSDLEEIVLDSYYRSLQGFDPAKGKFITFFFNNSRRAILDEVKRFDSVRNGQKVLEIPDYGIKGPESGINEFEPWEMSDSEMLRAAIDLLDRKYPEKQLGLIMRMYLEGKNHDEIAVAVDKSRSAVTKRISVCIAALGRMARGEGARLGPME